MVDKNLLGSTEPATYSQKHTVAKMKFIDLRIVRMLSSEAIYTEAEEIL
jgi:non-specific serine/threonine protein kinase